MARRKQNPHEMIEDAFHAMSLADQDVLLRVLAYIHRQALRDGQQVTNSQTGDS